MPQLHADLVTFTEEIHDGKLIFCAVVRRTYTFTCFNGGALNKCVCVCAHVCICKLHVCVYVCCICLGICVFIYFCLYVCMCMRMLKKKQLTGKE